MFSLVRYMTCSAVQNQWQACKLVDLIPISRTKVIIIVCQEFNTIFDIFCQNRSNVFQNLEEIEFMW